MGFFYNYVLIFHNTASSCVSFSLRCQLKYTQKMLRADWLDVSFRRPIGTGVDWQGLASPQRLLTPEPFAVSTSPSQWLLATSIYSFWSSCYCRVSILTLPLVQSLHYSTLLHPHLLFTIAVHTAHSARFIRARHFIAAWCTGHWTGPDRNLIDLPDPDWNRIWLSGDRRTSLSLKGKGDLGQGQMILEMLGTKAWRTTVFWE